jgi:hypothetical protein
VPDVAERAADAAGPAVDGPEPVEPAAGAVDRPVTVEPASGARGTDPAAASDPAVPSDPAVASDPAAVSDPAAPSLVPAAPPRRACLRRGLVAAGVALVVALAVSAFATAAPPVSTDQRFVDTARSQGYVLAGDQQVLVVSAARKICERRESHGTAAERRATALSSAELGAVQQAFPDDARAFTTLALDTYCPS